MMSSVSELSERWMADQSLAFAASLLGNLKATMSVFREHACAKVICANLHSIEQGLVSDSTLSLVATIDPGFLDVDALLQEQFDHLPEIAGELSRVVDVAKEQLAMRDQMSASGLNRMLISHSVYLLKRNHFSGLNFLKWLSRAVPDQAAVPGLGDVLQSLEDVDTSQLENSLARSRDPDRQTRDRVDDIDHLHKLVLDAAEDRRGNVFPWWTRICMAYRSSLFAWPLLTDGNEDECEKPSSTEEENADAFDGSVGTGLSLPISLFLGEDGVSSWKPTQNSNGQKIWFGYQLSRSEERTIGKENKPRFQTGDGVTPAHIEGYHFGFSPQWWNSFAIGVDTAKKLWSSQNGRLRYSDAEAAEKKLRADLNVDLRAASEIVETVYSLIPARERSMLRERDRYFVATGRSAEAYWSQCVLGLLLPSREVPMGLATGKVEYEQGEFSIHNVRGVVAKLEYANRAGVPRVVVPGDRTEFDLEEGSEIDDARSEISEFIAKVQEDNSRKTMEVNFARTARAAADAMQPSGWRRANFLRTPSFQRAFGFNQRRLYIRDALRDRKTKRSLKASDIDWYSNPKFRRKWFEVETDQLQRLDSLLLSNTGRSTRLVSARDLVGKVPGATVEETLAKWVAWKDNQVRSGEEFGYRGPGLGVLTLRTAEGDHEVRLWAALAELLDADEGWWSKFQWSDLPQAADRLAELLCNQSADPEIASGSAPDILIIFDDADLTRTRTNRIFPNSFHHQFFDLLNPRHPENQKHDFLDDAFKRFGVGALGHETRIIIVHDDGLHASADQEGSFELPELDRSVLERLAIFRFGSSLQAAFSMANFFRDREERLSWKQFEEIVDKLVRDKLLVRGRNNVRLSDVARRQLDAPSILRNPEAHLHAAHSICPILYPAGSRVSGNRDRQLEPENVLEADWHLHQASQLTPWRFHVPDWKNKSNVPGFGTSHALLTFLRTSPDWDTVKRLRTSAKTVEDSVSLSKDLFQQRKEYTGLEPSSTTIGLYIETLGRYFRMKHPGEHDVDRWAEHIERHVSDAVGRLDSELELKAFERKRRLRHLFSRQIFAFRMLGVPFDDIRMNGAKSYMDNAVGELLARDFIDQLSDTFEELNDFPISYDFWTSAWSDGNDEHVSLSLSERSTYAYAAARANLRKPRGQVFSGGRYTHEPWIAYFSLTTPEDFDRAQLVGPLLTWAEIYGQSKETASGFAERTMLLQKHALPPRKKGQPWRDNWSGQITLAIQNLWRFLVHEDASKRLTGKPAGVALDIIRLLGLRESIPAFAFLNACDARWLVFWPNLAFGPQGRWPAVASDSYGSVAEAWRALAREVLKQNAVWVSMMGSLENMPNDGARIAMVQNWVRAFSKLGSDELSHSDPENLLQKARSLPVVQDFRTSGRRAIENANSVLLIKKDRSNAISGDERRTLIHCKRSISY